MLQGILPVEKFNLSNTEPQTTQPAAVIHPEKKRHLKNNNETRQNKQTRIENNILKSV